MRAKDVMLKHVLFRIAVFILAASGFAFQAGTGDNIDVEHYTGKKIVIGTEGGLVSMRNETIILYTGQVYYHNNVINEYKYLKTLDKKQLKTVFKLIRTPGLPGKRFNHPGKMITFLQYYKNQKLIKDYAWGEPGVEIPAALDKTYSGIINIVK
jgi:hypothetical protein